MKRRDIVIGFDDEIREYYVIWHPPVAMGSGKSIVEALRDLREVIVFSTDHLTERTLRETRKGG